MRTGQAPSTIRPMVLVVEDDESVARVLRFALAAAGFEVTGVTTGVDALRLLEQGFAQAVVLDLVLADDLGGAVLEWLRQLKAYDLPVWIVISALDHREARRRYGPLGSCFFAKPFDPWDLVRTLEELLKGKRKRPVPDVETP